MSRLAQSLAVNLYGALSDVSDYADLSEGVDYSWGRTSQFDDVDASQFSFVLNNSDGRFTPGNPNYFNINLSEGNQVCWQLGSRLVLGRVISIEPVFPDGESAWSQVKLTCDDQLGDASRTTLGELSGSQAESDAYLYWPMDDPASASYATEFFGRGKAIGNTSSSTAAMQFGVAGPANLKALRVTSRWSSGATPQGLSITPRKPSGSGNIGITTVPMAFDYPLNSSGAVGFWANCDGVVGSPSVNYLEFKSILDGFRLQFSNNSVGFDTSAEVTVTAGWHYYAVISQNVGVTFTYFLLIDGVLSSTATLVAASVPTNADRQPQSIEVSLANDLYSTDGVLLLAQLSHTPSLVYGSFALSTTETNRLIAIARSLPTMTLDALPALLSPAPVGIADTSNQSALDALNDVVRTEQGYLYTNTTGTLLAPVQRTRVRERTRGVSVNYSFDVENELSGAPELVRDLTNMVSTVSVSGIGVSATVTDPTYVPRVGTKNTSETTVLATVGDVKLWGQDRLLRGANIRLRITSAMIDAMTTPTDRSADILTMLPGDRVRFTNLPVNQLGFSTWDGYLIGAKESHTLEDHNFTLYFEPVQDPTANFDVSEFMAGTSLTTTASINTIVTSLSVATADARISTTATDWPFTIVVDLEQMSVTNVTGATPQVLTVVRGVNGTTATAHNSGALVELANIPATADATVIYNYCPDPTANGGVPLTVHVGSTTSISTDWASSGSNSFKCVSTSTAVAAMRTNNIDRDAAVAGQVVTFATDLYNGEATSRSLSLTMRFYDTAGATLGSQVGSDTTFTATVNGTSAVKALVTATAPVGAVTVAMLVIRNFGSGGVTGDRFYIDRLFYGIDLPATFNPDTNWFLGANNNTPTVVYDWLGAAYASASYRASGGQNSESRFAF